MVLSLKAPPISTTRRPVPAASRAIWVPSAEDTRSSVVVMSLPSFTTAGASRLALMGRSGERLLDIAREKARPSVDLAGWLQVGPN